MNRVHRAIIDHIRKASSEEGGKSRKDWLRSPTTSASR